MASGRPFMQLSLDGLRAKVRDSPNSRSMLEEVRNELACRSTLGAKRLKREVETRLANAATTKAKKKLPETEQSASKGDKVERPSKANISGLEARYSALRATFTAEAEILSRWGMTSLAPPAVREAVFRYWNETLLEPSGQHPLGLGEEDLKSDIKALASEKRRT